MIILGKYPHNIIHHKNRVIITHHKHLTSLNPSLNVSETTLEILNADLCPCRFVYLYFEVSPEIRISGSPSFLLVVTFLSNQTTPLVTLGFHHTFMYSFLFSHKFDEAAIPKTMCLSSVSYLWDFCGSRGCMTSSCKSFSLVEDALVIV